MNLINVCDYFSNSLPIEKEDIVYSKYLLATIVIIISFIFTFLYSKFMNRMWGFNNFTIESTLSILSIILFLISILFPIIFKYGYRKVLCVNKFNNRSNDNCKYVYFYERQCGVYYRNNINFKR